MLFNINFILKNRLSVILSFIVITIFLTLGVQWIIIDDNILEMLPKNIESRESWSEIQNEFGNIDLMFVTIGEEDEFVLTAENLKIIWDLTKIIDGSPYVEEVISISTISFFEGSDGFLDISSLQKNRQIDENQLSSIINYFEDNPKISSQFFDKNYFFTNIIIRPVKNVNNNQFINSIIPEIEHYTNQIKIQYSGQPYLTGYVPELIQKDVLSLVIIGFIIMIIILFLNLKSYKAVYLILLTIILSMFGMMGFMGWMFKITGLKIFNFSIVHSSMPIILLTIANSDGVHVVTKFIKEYNNSKNINTALKISISQLRPPIFLTSITTAISFLTLVSSPINPLIGYGIVICFGIIWAWILSINFLPAMISNFKWTISTSSEKNHIERFLNWISIRIQKYPKLILRYSLLLMMISSVFILHVKIDVDFKNFFDENTKIRQEINFMDEKMGGYLNMAVKIKGDLKSQHYLSSINKIQDTIESNEKISFSFSIADIIKQIHKSLMDNDENFETIPGNQKKINNIFSLYSMAGENNNFSSIANDDFSTGLINFRMRSVSTEKANTIINEIKRELSIYFSQDSYVVSGILVVLRDMANLLVKYSFVNIFSAIFFIFLISWIYFKSYIWALISIIPLSFSIILNYGIMGFLNIELSHVTAILSSIIIGVGVDFAIHYVSRYKNLLSHKNHNSIAKNVITDVGYPIFLDAASNMAFISLVISVFAPVKYIGILLFFAMISSSLSTILIIGSISTIFTKNLKHIN